MVFRLEQLSCCQLVACYRNHTFLFERSSTRIHCRLDEISTGGMSSQCSRCRKPVAKLSTRRADERIAGPKRRSCRVAKCWSAVGELVGSQCWWVLGWSLRNAQARRRRLVSTEAMVGGSRQFASDADGFAGCVTAAGRRSRAPVLKTRRLAWWSAEQAVLWGRKPRAAELAGVRPKLGIRSDQRCSSLCKWHHRAQRSCNNPERLCLRRFPMTFALRWFHCRCDNCSRSCRQARDSPKTESFARMRRGSSKLALETCSSHDSDEAGGRWHRDDHHLVLRMTNELTTRWAMTRSTVWELWWSKTRRNAN